jgi:ABC-type multidrug transport system fused ATPase/permease subunit
MTTAPVAYDRSDPIIDRLEDQINWYDAKAGKYQKTYKRIKVVEIIAAALIPFLSALHLSDVASHLPITIGTFVAFLGVLITVLEGILQLNQYQQNWVTYRATCEAMKHEKFTYLARAGVYATAADARALLAERVETIGSQENSKWASLQQPQKVDKPVPAVK